MGAVTLGNPTTARAIPVEGTYEFTFGLVGTFTVTSTANGPALSAWQITDYFNNVWSNSDPNQLESRNNETYFQTYVPNGFTLTILWPDDLSDTSDGGDREVERPISYIERHVSAVPEPSSSSLVALGLLVLLGYGWRQRRQAGLQIG